MNNFSNTARIAAIIAITAATAACGVDATDEAPAAGPATQTVCFNQEADMGCRELPSDEDAMVHVMDARTDELMKEAIVTVVRARMAADEAQDGQDDAGNDERDDEGGPELSIEASSDDGGGHVEVQVRADGFDCWIAGVAPRGTVTIDCKPATDGKAQTPASAPREGEGVPSRTW